MTLTTTAYPTTAYDMLVTLPLDPARPENVLPQNRWDKDVRQLAALKLFRAYVNKGTALNDDEAPRKFPLDKFEAIMRTDHGDALVRRAQNDAFIDLWRLNTYPATHGGDEVSRTRFVSLAAPDWLRDNANVELEVDEGGIDLEAMLTESIQDKTEVTDEDIEVFLDNCEYLNDLYVNGSKIERKAIRILVEILWCKDLGLPIKAQRYTELYRIRKSLQASGSSWVLRTALLD